MWLVCQDGILRRRLEVERGEMNIFDKARSKLTKAVDKHGDKVADGIDKAAKTIDDKTGGKHSAKLESGADKAKNALDGLDGKDDDIR